MGSHLVGWEVALGQHSRSEPPCPGGTMRPSILPLAQLSHFPLSHGPTVWLLYAHAVPPRGGKEKGKKENVCGCLCAGQGPRKSQWCLRPRGKQVAYLGMAIANTYEKLHC